MLARRLAAITLGLLIGCAQETDTQSAAASTETVKLQSDQAKFSYVVALKMTESILAEGGELDVDAFSLGAEDAASGAEPRLTPEEIITVLMKHQQASTGSQRNQAEQNLQAARDYLAANRDKEGVTETDSGLQYKVQQRGDGPLPAATDTVKVHYTGTLRNGQEFDSSERRGVPAKFPVNGVIKGRQEALQLMPVGSRWTVFVPPALAYGPGGAGATIGPNEMLIFEVELLSIEK